MKRSRRRYLVQEQCAFLSGLQAGLSVKEAAAIDGINLSTAYQWRREAERKGTLKPRPGTQRFAGVRGFKVADETYTSVSLFADKHRVPKWFAATYLLEKALSSRAVRRLEAPATTLRLKDQQKAG